MKNIVLQPSFYSKFECIGSKCKFNCCTHMWRINFKKEEFRNIKRKIKTEEFREKFKDAFEMPKGEDNYLVKFDERGDCRFLDEDGLCSVYKEVGPENMSLTCKIFPRFCTYYIDRYECFLSIGCEEVIRLLLKEKEGISLEVIEREVEDFEKQSSERIVINKHKIKDNTVHYWNDLKILLLGVLQNREYTFGERMVVLGLAMRKVHEMQENNLFHKVPEYIENFILEFYDTNNKQNYSKAFQNINRDGYIRALNTLNFCGLGQVKNFNQFDEKIAKRIQIQSNAVMENLKITKLDVKFSTEKYQQAIKDFEEFLKGREWWIENVMIEGFLAIKMPFFVDGSIWGNYCAMALLYSAMLFMWTCLLEKDSTEEDFALYTSIIARELFHNQTYINVLKNHLKEMESDSLAHMAMLVL